MSGATQPKFRGVATTTLKMQVGDSDTEVAWISEGRGRYFQGCRKGNNLFGDMPFSLRQAVSRGKAEWSFGGRIRQKPIGNFIPKYF